MKKVKFFNSKEEYKYEYSVSIFYEIGKGKFSIDFILRLSEEFQFSMKKVKYKRNKNRKKERMVSIFYEKGKVEDLTSLKKIMNL